MDLNNYPPLDWGIFLFLGETFRRNGIKIQPGMSLSFFIVSIIRQGCLDLFFGIILIVLILTLLGDALECSYSIECEYAKEQNSVRVIASTPFHFMPWLSQVVNKINDRRIISCQ